MRFSCSQGIHNNHGLLWWFFRQIKYNLLRVIQLCSHSKYFTLPSKCASLFIKKKIVLYHTANQIKSDPWKLQSCLIWDFFHFIRNQRTVHKLLMWQSLSLSWDQKGKTVKWPTVSTSNPALTIACQEKLLVRGQIWLHLDLFPWGPEERLNHEHKNI